ncbi:MAG TPA: translation initiation factor IF-2 [Polyangiaceae bacterium]|nr:translation initiation factor IF-2 [Polyangiaceae bacterium]
MPKAPLRGGPGPRRVEYNAKAGTGGGPQGARGGRPGMVGGRMGGRGMRPRGIGSLSRAKGAGGPVTQERSAHKKVVRIEETIGLQALGGKIGVKATELLMTLMRLGMTGVNINTTLDADTAKIVANEFGWEVEDVAVSEQDAIVAAQGSEVGEEASENMLPRPPVVTVMGHVDHGKTSLLDQIRKTNVVSGEAGGITQHIGAYSVKTAHGPLTFLDTPGHEAFTQMRARGAQATDIVILVVAADDGVMPQTKEAIAHARAAGVPIVVAINKVDKPDAQPERVRRELSEQGLVPEEWGGDILFNEVSAVTRQGIDEMLDKVVLQAELLELRANPDKLATGIVVEAELDRGKGPVATVLVTDGTLQRGDVILAGAAYGRARAMIDSSGKQVQSAGPSTPVSLVGLNEVPSAGDHVYVIKDMKTAQELAEGRKTKAKVSLAPSQGNKPRNFEELAALMSEADQLELKLIIKADVQGSAEAVSDSLARLSGDKVKVTIVHSAAGAITENDVNLAVAAEAIIIGFNVRPAGKAQSLAQREGVQIRQYSIIYKVVDDVKAAMEGLLAPKMVEKATGKAEVRQLFKVSKAGTIAGCMVTDGTVKRSGGVRLMRGGTEIWSGKLSSLKRFKDDVREVKEGFDCGMALDGYNEINIGDIIEAFEIEEVKQSL